MRTITLNKHDIYKGPLVLINKDYPYHLHHVSLDYKDEIGLEKNTMKMLKHILHEIKAEDQIVLVSGYRTKQQQEEIYETSLLENGEDITKQFVAQVNHSEHQSGYAIDVALLESHIDFIRPHFPRWGVCEEFREIALRYGFIERYQKEKIDITHIQEEPWHFRYVGFPHSVIMNQQHMCLEEYHDFLKNYSIFQPYTYVYQNKVIDIFYVSALKEETKLCLNDKHFYQISGNNQDGFIITAWKSYS